jgi:hypothetical protein
MFLIYGIIGTMLLIVLFIIALSNEKVIKEIKDCFDFYNAQDMFEIMVFILITLVVNFFIWPVVLIGFSLIMFAKYKIGKIE